MPSRLESKTLRTVIDEGSQELSQTSNKSGVGDNLIAIKEARMPFSMSNDQEFRSHRERNAHLEYTRQVVKVKD